MNQQEIPQKLLTLHNEPVTRFLWKDVKTGDIVYLYATHKGKQYACGPFRVLNTQKRELCRCDSCRSFIHFPEELYRLEI